MKRSSKEAEVYVTYLDATRGQVWEDVVIDADEALEAGISVLGAEWSDEHGGYLYGDDGTRETYVAPAPDVVALGAALLARPEGSDHYSAWCSDRPHAEVEGVR